MTFLLCAFLALASLTMPAAHGLLNGAPEYASRSVESNPAYRGSSPVPLSGAPLSGSGSIGTPLMGGWINYADRSHGSGYLAMRLPRGTRVRICAAACVTMTVNDYGPVKATGKLADVALVRFAKVCGWSVRVALQRGVCEAEIEILGAGALPTAPPTDTEEGYTP